MIRSILGPNSFLAHRTLREQLNKIPEQDIVRFEADELDIDEFTSSLSAQGLFSTPTIVLSGSMNTKNLHDNLTEVISNANNEVELIIYEPQVDKRSKYYKFLLNDVASEQFDLPSEEQLVSWVVEEVKKRGADINLGAARHLVDRVGTDQWRLSNEVDKLVLADSKIDKSTIDTHVEPTPKESIFQLLDAVVSKNQERVSELYKDLVEQQMEAHYILSMIAWQFHIVALAVHSDGQSLDTIAKESGVSAFVLKKTHSSVRNVDKSQLNKMLELIAEADSKMKSVSVNSHELLLQTLLKLCRI